MHHFFTDEIDPGTGYARITGSDVNHLRSVLRMKSGDQVRLSGRDGSSYIAVIETIAADEVAARLLHPTGESRELPVEITLYQGLAKGDKMELIIQKAVELGAARIVPMMTKYCVVKLDPKKEAAKIKRWEGIAESAAKQSMRDMIPQILPVMSFHEAVTHSADCSVRLIPYEKADGMAETRALLGQVKPGGRVAVYIGPEGGFAEAEIDLAGNAGVSPITLGKRILRTETAGLCILSILMFQAESNTEN